MHRFERDVLRQTNDDAFAEVRAVRFQDVDAAGIIFYPRLLEYCHDLVVSFFAFAGVPLEEALRAKQWIAPIRHAEADYFRPLRFGDLIEVGLARVHLEFTEVALGFRITRKSNGEVCAVAQSVHTFLDPATLQRCELPEPLRLALLAIAERA